MLCWVASNQRLETERLSEGREKRAEKERARSLSRGVSVKLLPHHVSRVYTLCMGEKRGQIIILVQ